MGKLLFILFFISSFKAFGLESFYERPGLVQMPTFEQVTFAKIFKKHSLERAFIGDQGSQLLGVNLLFTDAFFSSTVAVKYDVKGNFTANRFYHFKDISAYHFKYKKKWVAFYFQNIDPLLMTKIANSVHSNAINRKEKRGASFFDRLTPFPQAYASETCSLKEVGTNVSMNSEVADMAYGGFVSRCLDGIGSGAEDSTIGVIEEAGNLIKKGANFLDEEARLLFSDPKARMSDYANFVGKGIGKLREFAITIGSMIKDPNYGARLLGKKFGQIGSFFASAYQSVKSMPLNAKVDVLCNLIGAIGTDVLITAITVGAAGGKLGVTVARLLYKLKKVAKLVGKGLAIPFKTMSKLGESSLARLERIIESGKGKLLQIKIKDMGCAI